MPIRDVSALGLGELLGSLLSAVVEGQRAATASSLAFVEEIGLTGTDTDQPESFRTVTIRYTKLDELQQPAEFELEVPLLAMVNIPTLTVKQAKISFAYDVLTTTHEEEDDAPTTSTTGTKAGTLIPLRPVTLRGYVPRRRTSDSKETTGISVEVTVESEPLPVGLERILDLTELTTSRQVPQEDP